MATRTKSRTSNRSNSTRSRSNQSNAESGSPTENRTTAGEGRSAFSWADNAGPIIAAALGGAAIGFAANYGRKFLMQGMEATVGDWDAILGGRA